MMTFVLVDKRQQVQLFWEGENQTGAGEGLEVNLFRQATRNLSCGKRLTILVVLSQLALISLMLLC